MQKLNGKVCFVTGGASGIGKEVTGKLLEMGASVFVLNRSQEKIDILLNEHKGKPVDGYTGSVAVEEDVTKAFAACREKFGPVDVLINNAGVGVPTPDLSETDIKAVDSMLDTNIRGVFLASREALKDMKQKNSGHIMTVISMAGQRTNPGAPVYCASKFGARGLSGGIFDQAVKYGVKVTDVNPGPVDTDYWGDRKVPRDKFLKPKDVAEVISFVLGCPDYMLIREINFDNINFLAR